MSVVSTIRSQLTMIVDEPHRHTDNFIKPDESKFVFGHEPQSSILLGPFDWFLEVGVPQEFPFEPLPRELHERRLQTGRSGQLHHRR